MRVILSDAEFELWVEQMEYWHYLNENTSLYD